MAGRLLSAPGLRVCSVRPWPQKVFPPGRGKGRAESRSSRCRAVEGARITEQGEEEGEEDRYNWAAPSSLPVRPNRTESRLSLRLFSFLVLLGAQL